MIDVNLSLNAMSMAMHTEDAGHLACPMCVRHPSAENLIVLLPEAARRGRLFCWSFVLRLSSLVISAGAEHEHTIQPLLHLHIHSLCQRQAAHRSCHGVCDHTTRWRGAHRLFGDDVWFTTGADENSLKNVQAAEREGIAVQALVDRNAAEFRVLADLLGHPDDSFLRTSIEPRHAAGVRKLWEACAGEWRYLPGELPGAVLRGL